ncbi:MAG TPA: response regulator [Thermoanaerobaculia bacterium]|nr:response regulator [Thermoanaerobaculia bacterium]
MSRVLVVDDEPSIRLLVARALEKRGFDVDSAIDGVEALQKLSERQYDLLVLDLMMPRLDGLGVIENLADRPAVPKILIMTAASPSVFSQIPRERVDGIINKPFDLGALVASAEKLSEPDGHD